jgi:putative hemolysin
VPFLAPYREALGIGIVVVIITYFSILLGELVPKRLGLNNAEGIASSIAGPMQWLSRVSLPVVRLLSWSSNAIFRLFKIRVLGNLPVTEEEIKVLIEQGAQAGVFEEAEQDMVSAVFRLTDRRVGSLMTPRTEIAWLDLDDPDDINQKKIVESVYDRFPIGRGDLDNVTGIIEAKRLLAACLNNKPLDFEKLSTVPFLVPESMPVLEVLELFRRERFPMALVFDEYGGIQGLVTTNDILSSIVGDMPQAGEETETSLVQREDGSWLVDGMFAIDEFKEAFRFKELPDEDRADFETLGGFVMAYLGRVPKPSDHFEWNGYRFEIMDMDGFRVDKVLVALITPEEK